MSNYTKTNSNSGNDASRLAARRVTHYALLSVFDKDRIEIIGLALSELGYQIIATEGTGAALNRHGIPFIPANRMSGNPDALKDCIQTIGFTLSAGILFDRNNTSHVRQTEKLKINPIDVVACNFPPVSAVIQKPEDFNIQHVDVGGPLMVRAAATNYEQVLVITDPNDYKNISEKLLKNNVSSSLRKKLAIKAFEYSRTYYLQITKFLYSF